MGETDKTKQGVETSASPEGSTSQETPTLTESQAKVREAKARSDALAELGRIRKAADDANKAAQAAVKRLQDKEDADLAREEAEAKDNPDELSRIRKRRQDAEREAKLTERETKIKTQLGRILQTTATVLATQYNVTSEMLLKYGGEDAESMEELARSYGERKPSGEDKSKTRITEPPDSGKTRGGGKGLTVESVRGISPEELMANYKEIAKLPLA